jgi:hypothetical protein
MRAAYLLIGRSPWRYFPFANIPVASRLPITTVRGVIINISSCSSERIGRGGLPLKMRVAANIGFQTLGRELGQEEAPMSETP